MFKGTKFEKTLCSECSPTHYPSGQRNIKGGKWHDHFPKQKATEKDKGRLLNFNQVIIIKHNYSN